MSASGLRATVEPCPDIAELEAAWRELEGRAQASFFLSWAWIGTMLREPRPPRQWIVVRRGNTIVGLALLGEGQARWPRPRLHHLNETGDPVSDGVMVEYNGLLAESGAEEDVQRAALNELAHAGGMRAFHLAGVPPALVERCRQAGLRVRLLKRHGAPFADLTAEDPLASLSRNSRQQIGRALRLYDARGRVAIKRADSAAQALDWLTALESLHTVCWHSRGKPGAFGNPRFAPFHRRLVEQSFDAGAVDMLRVTAGDTEIGYLYNFRHGSHACAYQSGFRYEADPRLKPGLVCHLMAMRLYRSDGLSRYRFLAGDSRYKASLANGSDELVWVLAHRGDPVNRLEDWIRSLRAGAGEQS